MIQGRGQGELASGEAALAAFRPEDAAVDPSGRRGLRARVQTMEYRGRDFVGTAVTAEGLSLVFEGQDRVDIGGWIALSPDPSRVLVFPGAGTVG